MTGEAVPDALDALYDLWSGLGIAELQVIDGPPWDVEGNFLTVAWDRTDSPSVSQTAVQFTRTRSQESFEVSNLLSLWLGNSTMRVVRRQLYTTYRQLAAAVTAEPTLGGVVQKAWPTSQDMTPDVGESGEFIDLRFTVTCVAVN